MDKINERGKGLEGSIIAACAICHSAIKKNRNEQHVPQNFIAVCIKHMRLIDGMHLLTSTDAVGEKEEEDRVQVWS